MVIAPVFFGETTDAFWFYCGNCGAVSNRGGYRGGLQKLSKAGGELSVVYVPPAPGSANDQWYEQGSAIAGRAGVFFSTPPYVRTSPLDTLLLRLPASQATPVRVAAASAPDNANPLEPGALDDASVFFSRGTHVYRVAHDGGTPIEIAELDVAPVPYTTNLTSMTILGADLFISVPNGTVIRTPRNASSKAEQVRLTASNPCPTRRLWPARGGFYCADARGISHYNADLTEKTTIYELQGATNPPAGKYGDGDRRLFIVGIDSNRAFFVSGTETGEFTLRTFEVGDTTTKLVGCGFGQITGGLLSSSSVYLEERRAPEYVTRILEFPR